MTTKEFFKDALGWGSLLWFIGYMLGMVLFFVMPVSLIGWVLTPVGIGITVFILIKKINGSNLKYYFIVALTWTAIAILFDYFFLVKLFNPADGYYKPDVYLYYTFTFILPLIVGWRKTTSK